MSSSISSFRAYLIWLLLLGLGLYGAIYAASSWLIVHKVEPADHLFLNLDLLENSRSKNAAFGDSRAAFDFTGGDGFLNLAYPGENILDLEIRVKRFYRDKQGGKAILQADPLIFASYRLNKPPHSYFGTKPGSWIIPLHRRPKIWKYWKTLFKKGGFRASRIFHDTGWQEARGDYSSVEDAVRHIETQREARQHTPTGSFQTHAAAAIFEGVIRYLREKNIEVCLVSYPVSADYAKVTRATPTFAVALAHFDALARRLGVARVNLFYDYARREDFPLFADTDHLNARGAKRLSPEILARCFGAGPGS